MYFHEGECLNKHIEHKKFLEKEQEEKDELYYKLVRIHGLEKTTDIPPLFFQKVEDLRNDNWILGRFDKKYKKGVRYSGISYTYDYCEKKIKEALNRFSDKTILEQMFYCLAIVKNNIVNAFHHAKRIAQQKQNTDNLVNRIESMAIVRDKIKQSQYRKQHETNKDEIDLTTLLD